MLEWDERLQQSEAADTWHDGWTESGMKVFVGDRMKQEDGRLMSGVTDVE